jgi:hypothetical protein
MYPLNYTAPLLILHIKNESTRAHLQFSQSLAEGREGSRDVFEDLIWHWYVQQQEAAAAAIAKCAIWCTPF